MANTQLHPSFGRLHHTRVDTRHKWAVEAQDREASGLAFNGFYTMPTRAAARVNAKHRSRFDGQPWLVYRKEHTTDGSVVWEHVETYDFHKAIRSAFA